MNISINNTFRSFKTKQGAKSEPVGLNSPKKYYDTKSLAFKSIDKEEENKSSKTKSTAMKVAGVAIAAGALGYAIYKGKKMPQNAASLLSQDEYLDMMRQSDRLLGKDFFSETFQKTRWNNYNEIKETNFFQDVLSTIIDIPGVFLDIANGFLEKQGKTPNLRILRDRAAQQETYDARNLILNIASQYKKSQGDEEKFAAAIAKNINHKNPNYRTRDERVLNRILTGLVSTYYAGNDFYNISMLKKDDKKEATESANSRMKQESSRMFLNAASSFFTYGALDKYIKNSKIGTVLSAGISALFAEVVSRLISDTPLLPLTTEQARKKAQKNKSKLDTISKENLNNFNKAQVSFKGTVSQTEQSNIFKNFANDDGSFEPLNEMNKIQEANQVQNNSKQNKKNNKFLAVLGGAFALFSLYYLVNSSKRGHEAISDFYKKTGLSSLKRLIKNKKVMVDTDSIKTRLTELSTETDIDGNSLAKNLGADKLLNTYSNMIDNLAANGKIIDGKMETTQERFLISALYKGFAKMGNTIAMILSAPGRIIRAGYDKIFSIAKEEGEDIISSQKTSIAKLNGILKDNAKNNATSADTIKDIVKNVQDVKAVELEMSDLASDCRTIVTGVSTYFFINDYRNKVLIESEGKDVEGANAEAKERLAHKAFNFVFNGTLMNIFNKTFEKAINKNIWIAGLVAMMTEFCNENLIRFSICSPANRMKSKEDIIKYDEERANKGGFLGTYTKFFKKLTGKKTIVEKAGHSKTTSK